MSEHTSRAPRLLRRLPLLLLLLVAANCSDSVGPDQVSEGQIIFERLSVGASSDIWIVKPDGSGARQLTMTTWEEFYPRLSPDGKRFAYTSQQHNEGDIYVANVNGSGVPIRLTSSNKWEGLPVWSPDGSKLVFESQRDGYEAIATINSDGSNYQVLTPVGSSSMRAAWSPDGQRIVFLSSLNGGGMNIMNADGSGARLLDADGDNPSWSADGTEIIFESGATGKSQLYAIKVDGTGRRRVSISESNDAWGSYSPDGARIVFHSDRSGEYQIWVMNADGTGARMVTPAGARSRSPHWSR